MDDVLPRNIYNINKMRLPTFNAILKIIFYASLQIVGFEFETNVFIPHVNHMQTLLCTEISSFRIDFEEFKSVLSEYRQIMN